MMRSSTTLILSTIVLGTMAGQVKADTVLLHPGTLAGTISLSGETVTSGYVSTYSPDGYSSQGSFSGSSFSLTVEGDHFYYTTADAYISNGSNASYLQMSHGVQVNVPVGGTGQSDFIFDAARITGTITVNGGTLNSYYIYAYASENSDSYYARSYFYSGGSTYSAPMVQDSSVQVYGTASVTTGSGATLTLPLTAQTISVGPGGGVADWTLDATLPLGTIAGQINLNNPIGGPIVSSHQLYAYGADQNTSGTYAYTSVTGNGAYAIPNLLPGGYSSYAYSYFNSPYGFYYHPYRASTVLAGQTTTNDYVSDLGFQHGHLLVNGFFNTNQLAYARIASSGTYPSASYGAQSFDYIDPDGTYHIAVTPGEWKHTAVDLAVYDYSDPNNPLNVYMSRYDYDDPNFPGILAGPGDNITLPDVVVTTLETNIIFDVDEAPGDPEVDIIQPRIYAYSYVYGQNGSYLGYKYLDAYGSSNAAPQQTLRLVGQPGDYDAYAYAYVDGSYVQFARFTLKLRIPVQTPAGTNVQVQTGAANLTFSNVTTGGVSTSTISPIGPAAPSGFQIYNEDLSPVYVDITTTAIFDGPVQVCLFYQDFGLTAAQEALFRLMHYNQTTSSWEDITAAGYPDINFNMVCGLTESFSPFALFLPLSDDTDGDGINDDVDNCPAVSNADQADADGDGQGNACDVDSDNDGVEDADDNCPYIANDQSDYDRDGQGDACDADDDNDSVADADDRCAMTASGDKTDAAGCSSAQRLNIACPTTGVYRNHGDYVSCVSNETSAQVKLKLISGSQKGVIDSEAAQSSIGKK